MNIYWILDRQIILNRIYLTDSYFSLTQQKYFVFNEKFVMTVLNVNDCVLQQFSHTLESYLIECMN